MDWMDRPHWAELQGCVDTFPTSLFLPNCLCSRKIFPTCCATQRAVVISLQTGKSRFPFPWLGGSRSPWVCSGAAPPCPAAGLGKNPEISGFTVPISTGRQEPSSSSVTRSGAVSGQGPALPAVSRSQTFTVLSSEAVAMLGASAGPHGRKTPEVVVWKCPLYSHTWVLVCRRSHSCRAQAEVRAGCPQASFQGHGDSVADFGL